MIFDNTDIESTRPAWLSSINRDIWFYRKYKPRLLVAYKQSLMTALLCSAQHLAIWFTLPNWKAALRVPCPLYEQGTFHQSIYRQSFVNLVCISAAVHAMSQYIISNIWVLPCEYCGYTYTTLNAIANLQISKCYLWKIQKSALWHGVSWCHNTKLSASLWFEFQRWNVLHIIALTLAEL